MTIITTNIGICLKIVVTTILAMIALSAQKSVDKPLNSKLFEQVTHGLNC